MADLILKQQKVRLRAKPRPVRANPVWRPGDLPLAWKTIVDPDKVIIHVTKDGEPIAKGRPRIGKNGHTFTPERTVQAEQDWGWVMRASRRFDGPVGTPIGVLLLFRLPTEGRVDGDNLAKLVFDAGNRILWLDDKQIHESHVHLIRGCSDPGTDLLAWIRR